MLSDTAGRCLFARSDLLAVRRNPHTLCAASSALRCARRNSVVAVSLIRKSALRSMTRRDERSRNSMVRQRRKTIRCVVAISFATSLRCREVRVAHPRELRKHPRLLPRELARVRAAVPPGCRMSSRTSSSPE